MARLLSLALSALALSAASAQDTCAYTTELDCLKAGGRTDYACAWCKSAAVPSSCATLSQASKLPPGVFDCGNSTRSDCDLQKTVDACQTLVGCLWCTSKTVKPICGNYMNTSTLPKSVFTCAGPYEEEEEEQEAAPADEPADPAASADAVADAADAADAAAAVATAPTNYDFFMLVQQWAITECQDVFLCTATAQYFTLHGLWPERTDGSYPQTCPGAPAFDPSKLKPLLPALNTYWPSLNGPSQTFWQHEYEKHGSCATDVFPTEVSYFNGTLGFLSSYNITTALSAHGIVPSNTKSFELTAFNDALVAELGFSAELTCDSQHRVETATFCVAKTGKLMACPPAVPRKCSGGLAYLPASMP
jgi:ribonuclease T2